MLSPDNYVKGKCLGTLDKITTNLLLNIPAVYAFHCLINNKYYIGETINIKNRLPQHLSNLGNGKGNSAFCADFASYGKKNFEFILIQSGIGWESEQTRRALERKLQDILIPQGLCYNTGRAETIGPRPIGKFPSTAGLYGIYNKINNIWYFGETGQRRGLNKRLSDWKRRLNDRTANNEKLLADWRFYGQDAFEFHVIASGPEWANEDTRRAEEARLIADYKAKGGLVYNFSEEEKKAPRCQLASRELILASRTPEARERISIMNTGRANLIGRKAIVAEGNIYFSVIEAARCLGYGENRSPVKNAIRNGKYLLATPEQAQQELERRQAGGEPVVIVRNRRQVTGLAEGVFINVPERGIENAYFASMSDAAKALRISVQAVSKNIKNGKPGYYLAQNAPSNTNP